ncbi:MAG: amidohydrolase family protein [Solirubrobacterales bacterium]
MAGHVDTHFHYLTETLTAALEARSEPPRVFAQNGGRAIQYGEANGHDLYPEMLDLDAQLRDMDEAGIDLAVMTVQVPGVDWFEPADGVAVARDVNDELVQIVSDAPDRRAALALLPMQAPEEAAAELERAVGAGLRGGIVFSNTAGENIDAPAARVVFDTAASLDVPIMIHPTFPQSAAATDAYALIPTIGFLVDTSMAALRLVFDGVYDRNPDFKLHLCHAGSLLPQVAGRLDYESMRFPGGLGKTEGRPTDYLAKIYTDIVCLWPSAIENAIALVGPDHMMFGTDYSFWEMAPALEAFSKVGVDDEVRAAISSANARAFYGLPA